MYEQIVTLFKITKKCKQPKYPLIEEWINKMQHIQTKDYCFTTKKNEAMKYYNTYYNTDEPWKHTK